MLLTAHLKIGVFKRFKHSVNDEVYPNSINLFLEIKDLPEQFTVEGRFTSLGFVIVTQSNYLFKAMIMLRTYIARLQVNFIFHARVTTLTHRRECTDLIDNNLKCDPIHCKTDWLS